MNTRKISFIAILALTLLAVSSCEKEPEMVCGFVPDNERGEQEAICGMGLESLEDAPSDLLGIWEWRFVTCGWDAQSANANDFAGLTVHIRPNHTLTVIENGEETTYCSWSIDHSGNSSKLTLSEPVSQLDGFIDHKDETLLLDARAWDGCQNQWQRVSTTF